jgi:hypothetical protein
VYVESNFVLEQALQQEQCDSCDEILNLAVSGLLSLVVPAFSLAEPHHALALKAKARNRLSNELRSHVSELGRSRPYRAVSDDFTALASILIQSAEQERDGLQRTVGGLLRTAEIIPLDSMLSLPLPNSRQVWACQDRMPSSFPRSSNTCRIPVQPKVAS